MGMSSIIDRAYAQDFASASASAIQHANEQIQQNNASFAAPPTQPSTAQEAAANQARRAAASKSAQARFNKVHGTAGGRALSALRARELGGQPVRPDDVPGESWEMRMHKMFTLDRNKHDKKIIQDAFDAIY